MTEKKSGYVAIIGRPNVGKSTLINALIGEKVTIVTSKPQTTVQNIIGILNDEDSQIILVDTPGLVSNKKIASHNKTFNKSVLDALASSDVIVMLSEANKWTKTDEQLLEQIDAQSLPSIHVVNKVDKQAYLSAYALANYVIVTCDSTSMISEAATSGKPIFVAHMKAKKNNYRFKRFFELFKQMGITRDLGEKVETWTYNKHNEAQRIAAEIKNKIKN